MSAAGVLCHAVLCPCSACPQGLQSKGLGLFRPQQGGACGLPHLGGSARPAISPTLSLIPPHLIEVLSGLKQLSYCSRYLLKSTNPSTSGAFYLCSGNTGVLCSLQANHERQNLPYLLQQARPSSPSKHFPSTQAISQEFVQFHCG